MRLRIAGVLLVVAGPAMALTVPAILPVFAVVAGKTEITVRVPPWGCTPQKSDLTVAVAKIEGRPLLLIARKHPDDGRTCRSAAAADITWPYEDLGLEPGQPFVLANPLVGDPSAGP